MKVPFYRHSLDPKQSIDVERVLKSEFLTSGPIGKEVESQLRDYFEVRHSKLVSSWTNGAVATLLAMDIGPGDEVIVPAMTFVATANVVELVGAKPIFVDCNPDSLLMEPHLVQSALTPKTKAVIPVHMYGQMCDIEAIKKILPKNQTVYIIEDCAHSFEAKRNGQRPGVHSSAAIFSFYATKNIACGEGGAVITNDSNLFKRITQSVLHGMSVGASERFNTGEYRHWDVEHLGTKANLPDLLACLLPIQIETVDSRLVMREKIANYYEDSLRETKIRMPIKLKNVIHSRHLFPIFVEPTKRDFLLSALGKAGIGATVNYRAVPTLNYYKKKYGNLAKNYPISYEWGEGTLSLPLYPSLKKEEQDYIIKFLKEKID